MSTPDHPPSIKPARRYQVLGFNFLLIFLLVTLDFTLKQHVTTPYTNSVAAFSLPLPTWLTVSIALVLIAILILWLYLTPHQRTMRQYAIIFLIAGGISNTLERILRGYVTDIVHFPSLSFNLADLFIILGIIGLLFNAFLTGQKNEKQPKPD